MKKFITLIMMLLGSSSFAFDAIMYHRVSDELPNAEFNVTRARFIEHVTALESAGYTFMSVENAVKYGSSDERIMAITFDDGWASSIWAARYLHSRGIPSTHYIISGTIGTDGYLSRDQLATLSSLSTVEIGSHSHTHFLEWQADLQKIDHRSIIGEMAYSKRELELLTGRKINSFAWPYGHIDARAHGMLGYLGFQTTMGVSTTPKNTTYDPLSLTRVNVSGKCTAEQLTELLLVQKYIICK